MSWAQEDLNLISAVYVALPQNLQADFLSRTTIDNNEQSLFPQVFRIITQWAFLPEVDLFASSNNSKLPCFFFNLCPLFRASDAIMAD